MDEDAGFLDAIRKQPSDETARLVYADWLEERGDRWRAEFLRVESRLRQDDGPTNPSDVTRWLRLRDEVPAEWVAGLGPRVNGLPLPAELAELLADGRWASAGEGDAHQSPWGRVYAYTRRAMGSETRQVCAQLRWLGRPDVEHHPGDIDPNLTVLIGDEGIGSDAPFALDHRPSFARPRVLLYRWGVASDDLLGNRWVEVAPDFAAFWDQLRGTR